MLAEERVLEGRANRSALRVKAVDLDLLDALRDCRAYPSVSVLLPTTPASALASPDVVRLDGLVERAERRLSGAAAGDRRNDVLTRLRALAVAVRRSATGHGLALFASESRAEAIQLPVTVEERVVVGPAFATRDLLRALHADPRCRLLVLSERRARLFEGRSTQRKEVTAGGFPLSARPATDRRDRSRRFGHERSQRRGAALSAHMRAVDAALDGRCAREPLPLVTAGVARQLALFRELSSSAGKLVGELRGNHERTPTARLGQLARPVIQDHCRALCQAALGRLDSADRARLAVGIDQVSAAAVQGRIGMLCVEEGFILPARTAADGPRLVPAEIEDSEALDDTIDELIVRVISNGGETFLVEDGALHSRQRVAGLLRP